MNVHYPKLYVPLCPHCTTYILAAASFTSALYARLNLRREHAACLAGRTEEQLKKRATVVRYVLGPPHIAYGSEIHKAWLKKLRARRAKVKR